MMEGVNSTMIYCKNFGKCHNVPSVQNKKKKAKEGRKERKKEGA
jgi:hypothetical protein